MTKTIGCLWTVEWGNPFKKPPAGQAEVLAESFQLPDSSYWSKHPPEIDAAYPGPGKGYCISWRAISEPVKPITKEQLANIRTKRLKRRLMKKYPLFWKALFEDEVSKKADYYAGITDSKIEAERNARIEQEKEQIRRYLQEAE
jgi:hypothetical protein